MPEAAVQASASAQASVQDLEVGPAVVPGLPAASSPSAPRPRAVPLGGLPAQPAGSHDRLGLALQRSHILRRPEQFLARARQMALWAGIVGLLPPLAAIALLATGSAAIPVLALVPLVALPAASALTTYALARTVPHLHAVMRAREIDAKLPYALNYLATLSASGATPQALFSSLARQPIYGAVAREAARLTRDIDLLGCDVVTAMARAGERTASLKWQDLLQGAITSLTSGGDLRAYFRDKAEQFLLENRHDQKRFLEGLGVLAECFVTVVVAAPLFLIVILSVMTSLGGSVQQTVVVGYTLVLVVLPVSQAGFVLTIRTMTPKA